MNIGEIIRDLRKKKKMPLVELSQLVGVTASHISQIERDQTSPSITVLKKIAGALDVPITYFFEDKEINSSIIRKDSRKRLLLPDSNLVYELLTPTNVKGFQLLMTRIEVGGKVGEEPIGHDGDECCFILKGKVNVVLHDKTEILNEGDSIFFVANTPHTFINIGDIEVVMLSAISPARF